MVGTIIFSHFISEVWAVFTTYSEVLYIWYGGRAFRRDMGMPLLKKLIYNEVDDQFLVELSRKKNYQVK